MATTDNHGHDHSHDHDDDHPGAAPMVDEISDFEVLELAVRELAIEKGLFTAEDHRVFSEWNDARSPAAGSRMVAKAWLDPEYKARVFSDPLNASKEVGVDWAEPSGFGTTSDYMHLTVLENTPTLHHVIVCTLCSCYPRPLLGHSPYWYRAPNYRRRIVRWPRQVLAEFGLVIPAEVEVRVEDSNAKSRFIVLPVRPEGTEGWSEDQLAEIVTRDCMIGIAQPKPGRTTDGPRPIHKASRPVHSGGRPKEATR